MDFVLINIRFEIPDYHHTFPLSINVDLVTRSVRFLSHRDGYTYKKQNTTDIFGTGLCELTEV